MRLVHMKFAGVMNGYCEDSLVSLVYIFLFPHWQLKQLYIGMGCVLLVVFHNKLLTL